MSAAVLIQVKYSIHLANKLSYYYYYQTYLYIKTFCKLVLHLLMNLMNLLLMNLCLTLL